MIYLELFFLLLIFSFISVAFFTLMERRILGNFHLRLGPFLVGFLGLFQPFSDAIKLFCKSEDSLRYIQNFYWFFSPFIYMCLYMLFLLVYPLGGGEFFVNGIYMIFICFLSFSIYLIMYGGFHSGSKYSLIGSYRSVVQMVSYEVVFIFMFVGYFYLINSWNFSFKFYEYSGFMIFFNLIFYFIWVIVMFVESNRLPYDFLEGESELVSGFNTEYWGGFFSFFFIYEYGSMILFCILTSYFMFSGFMSFFLFVILLFLFLWVRSTVPRFRYDFLMILVWSKFLFLILCMFLYFFVF